MYEIFWLHKIFYNFEDTEHVNIYDKIIKSHRSNENFL